MNNKPINVLWFRRDLRLEDNTALYHSLKAGLPVLAVFIFDKAILDKLKNIRDPRLLFIHQELSKLNAKLKEFDSGLSTYYGKPTNIWEAITSTYNVQNVFANSDYEPYSRTRDNQVKEILKKKNITFHTFKDHVIFEPAEVMKDDGKPYTVFTPFSRKWKTYAQTLSLESLPSEQHLSSMMHLDGGDIHSLQQIGFEQSDELQFPERKIPTTVIKNYHNTRDYPFIPGTSRLSLHLRFGTISIRKTYQAAIQLSEKWLDELIWREFYQMIIYHFPESATNSFKTAYDRIAWQNNEEHFIKWCEGKTGYPMVDAGMRELNATGFMHNRVRMVAASFLTKHLLIDWRWGEAYFAEKLLDYELASNVGGWQWAAGSGCDAAPYFRIFNPESQMNKFDPEKKYIRKWIREFDTDAYPPPIVDHKMARERCLKVYKEALSG